MVHWSLSFRLVDYGFILFKMRVAIRALDFRHVVHFFVIICILNKLWLFLFQISALHSLIAESVCWNSSCDVGRRVCLSQEQLLLIMETRIFCEIPSSFHSFQTIARLLIDLLVSVMEVRCRRHGGITYLHCVDVIRNSCRILLPYTKLKNLMLWGWIHVTNWRNHLFISLYLWFCSFWRISLSSDLWVVLVALSALLGHNFLFCLCRNL